MIWVLVGLIAVAMAVYTLLAPLDASADRSLVDIGDAAGGHARTSQAGPAGRGEPGKRGAEPGREALLTSPPSASDNAAEPKTASESAEHDGQLQAQPLAQPQQAQQPQQKQTEEGSTPGTDSSFIADAAASARPRRRMRPPTTPAA